MRNKKPEPGAAADAKGKARPSAKKKYGTPKLVEYGNLREIVMAKPGSRGDGGGKPKTKL